MRFRYTAASLAIMAFGTAHADEDTTFKLGGFGTLAGVHSTERQADFIGNPIQPNGAGYTRSTSLNTDSKLAVQLDAAYKEKLTAVVQVIAQHQHDNSYTPKVEWANVKYQLTPELSVRLGRIATPTFLVSESRLVGYANTLVRQPTEVYGLNPITNNDGLDASYRSSLGGVNNTLQGYYGKSTITLPGGGKIKNSNAWGFANSAETGALTLRLGVSSAMANLDVEGVNALIAGLNQFAAAAATVPLPAAQTASAQASAMSANYRSDRVEVRIFTIGASYDPGSWFVTGEFAAERFKKGFFSDANAWYVSGGYHFGSLTPYASYASAKQKSRSDPGISPTGVPQLDAAAAALSGGVNAVLGSLSQSQTTAAIGLRWDAMNNVSVKSQFERISLGDNSSGRLVNAQPGFTPGGKLNVVTVAVDFVF